MAKRIAISGRPKAGKTTLARYLAEHYNYRRASMSSVIVDEYSRLLNEPWMVESRGYEIGHGEILRMKESYRGGLQVVGDDMGFQDPEKIIGIMQRALKLAGAWDNPDDPVVLEAIRGEMQASAARALGFVVVNLSVDENTQRDRVGSDEAYQQLRSSMQSRPDIEGDVDSASVLLNSQLPLSIAANLLVNLPDQKGMSRGPANQPFQPGSLASWA